MRFSLQRVRTGKQHLDAILRYQASHCHLSTFGWCARRPVGHAKMLYLRQKLAAMTTLVAKFQIVYAMVHVLHVALSRLKMCDVDPNAQQANLTHVFLVRQLASWIRLKQGYLRIYGSGESILAGAVATKIVRQCQHGAKTNSNQ